MIQEEHTRSPQVLCDNKSLGEEMVKVIENHMVSQWCGVNNDNTFQSTALRNPIEKCKLLEAHMLHTCSEGLL